MSIEGRFAACRYCNESGLTWKVRDGILVLLHSDGKAHACERMQKFMEMQATAKPMQMKAGYRPANRTVDPCPPEAVDDLTHPWWDFLDAVEPVKAKR